MGRWKAGDRVRLLYNCESQSVSYWHNGTLVLSGARFAEENVQHDDMLHFSVFTDSPGHRFLLVPPDADTERCCEGADVQDTSPRRLSKRTPRNAVKTANVVHEGSGQHHGFGQHPGFTTTREQRRIRGSSRCRDSESPSGSDSSG